MSLTRVTEPDDDPDAWAVPREDVPDRPADDYTEEKGEAAVERFADAVVGLRAAVTGLDADVDHAARWLGERLDVEALVETYATLRLHREAMQRFEATVARETGHVTAEVAHMREGTLPDGRPYKVRRKADRKEWDHERWQRDARAEIIDRAGLAAVVDAEGELLDAGEVLASLLADVENVHGAGPPRLTVMRALSLDPDEYSHVERGTWTIDVASEVSEATDSS